MAGQRLTDKTALGQQTGSGDLYMVVDVSDTTGSSAGTSKKLDSKFLIQTDKISVSNADLGGLKATPKTLVSAPGSGFMIIPFSVMLSCNYVSDAEGTPCIVYAGYELDPTYYWGSKVRVMLSVTADRTYFLDYRDGLNAAYNGLIPDNKPFQLYSDQNFDSTDLTMDVYVTYQIVKIL